MSAATRLRCSAWTTVLRPPLAGAGISFRTRTSRTPTWVFPQKAKAAAHALYSPSARRAMRDCIGDFEPDLAHIRGVYHHLSPSILWELRQRGVPVIYHLNDFKILCPTYNLVARGQGLRCLPARRLLSRYYRRVLCAFPLQRGSSGSGSLSAQVAAQLRNIASTCFSLPSEFVRSQLIDHGLR